MTIMITCRFLNGDSYVFVQNKELTVADMIATLQTQHEDMFPTNADKVSIIATGSALDEQALLSSIRFCDMACVHVVYRLKKE